MHSDGSNDKRSDTVRTGRRTVDDNMTLLILLILLKDAFFNLSYAALHRIVLASKQFLSGCITGATPPLRFPPESLSVEWLVTMYGRVSVPCIGFQAPTKSIGVHDADPRVQRALQIRCCTSIHLGMRDVFEWKSNHNS